MSNLWHYEPLRDDLDRQEERRECPNCERLVCICSVARSGETPGTESTPITDAARLLWVTKMVDGIGEADLHEQASVYASAFGRDEPNDADFLAAVRDAIDAVMIAENRSAT